MNIELHGANARNFGAELMLRTTVSELTTRTSGQTFAMMPAEGDLPLRGSLGVLGLVPADGRLGTARTLPVRLARLGRKKWESLQRHYALLDGGRVEAMIDLSGFRLSDQWGPRAADGFAYITKAYADRRAPVILLPQAFGPFKNPSVADAAARAFECSTIVFARDQVSAEHVRALGASVDLRIAPDITLTYGHPVSAPDLGSAPVSIIPNARMLDRQGHSWTVERYLSTVESVLEQVRRSGRDVQFLLHTTEQADENVAETLLSRISAEVGEVPIVRPRNAREAKSLLANSWAIIGSRYHALAGALSTSRPTIGIGWSHKYRGLFSDFDADRFLVSPTAESETISDLVDGVLQPDVNAAISNHLAGRLEAIRDLTDRTWLTVTRYLEEHSS